ncbi:MAG TPA: hypothetical protein VGC46_07180 [Allosphingosinicella sp.]
MTRAPFLLALAAAALPAAAGAQTTNPLSRTFAVNANVPRACAISAPQLAAGAQINFRGLNGTTLQIDQLVDPTTLSTNAASVEVSFEAICNLPHRVRLETQNNGLWQTSEVTPARVDGFGFAIPYRARLDWADDVLLLVADAQVRRISESSLFVNESRMGDIRIRFEIDPGASNDRQNAPILAGFYGDTIRVILEPQQ